MWHELGDGLGGACHARRGLGDWSPVLFQGEWTQAGVCPYPPKLWGPRGLILPPLEVPWEHSASGPPELASQAHTILGIVHGFPGPGFLLLTLVAWGGHLSGWMESPA